MNGVLISFLAGGFAATSNLIFRKSSDRSAAKSYNYYLLFFYLGCFVASFLVSPTQGPAPFNPIMFGVGCVEGALSMFMMWLTSRALLTGPSGLSFAIQNASAIFPGLILFSLFGPLFGFQITFMQILGMGVVVLGLFLGATQNKTEQSINFKWAKCAVGAFIVQTLALSLIHWRCLLFADSVPDHPLIPWRLPESCDAWFLPGQFGTALVLQLGIILLYERRPFTRTEALYGTLGSMTNLLSSFCLLMATKIASPFEQGLIFPSFAAITMILCNIWANRLYHERFNWTSNSLCAAGIVIGSAI